ncbi:bifunctional methylenetetrahydrofolate dehydrogenase/methenyltetrahydrofolate cyclohydrolase FolD [Paenibacillus oenotherae]|uniref:Bifunctional protein FolD n=1 Tax=Paenibacillus oenotherae TaxID=1435645 RepID=A0ABS7D1T6_9BACL|nr:bifunctional methylenetetrahydrofolate dehydrogenase/methenyltetrahydrofolate cyclohydrolase FolD [Paenibacillus oenotherae]MBW7473547.1 bifunctional methylenetetrahydrofolate dehydrogenase/methenyltetrahydrofolate cyclohydrolase FolD [Paenibacillus oenotherae]
MSAQRIEGKQISDAIRVEIGEETAKLAQRGIVPGLAVVLVGEDPASKVYVGSKEKACQQLGFYSEVHRLPASTTQEELLAVIDKLNNQSTIHGILVQLPLPKHIEEKPVIDAISVHKDVDGFHPISVGNLTIGDDSLLPCTPSGVIELIKRTGIEIAGRHAVVIGRSNIVGKPVAMLLLREHATVTICHSRTADMEAIAKTADILVVAIGKPKAIGRSFVKPGAVIIDVGINRLPDGKLAGDVDYDDVLDTAGYVTPVPGGVGPMTITMLMLNTLKAAKQANGIGE